MVRDIESLIEYLYLLSINSELLNSRIIVNPQNSDRILGKIVIINKIYQEPNLNFADKVIRRELREYESIKNPYICGVNIELINSVFVFLVNNLFYFGIIPKDFLIHPCFRYLFKQVTNNSFSESLLMDKIQNTLSPQKLLKGKTEESGVSEP